MQIVLLPFDKDDLMIVRQALKLLLQATPYETREPVAQLLCGIELHLTVMLKMEAKCPS
jgi:hypothetical protein